MANRRMFSLDIIDTDMFLDMSPSAQSLYFHLGMRADDDGFVSSPKRITNSVSSTIDDLKLLVSKGFIVPFESGVCVIRHWKLNNYIQKDRYKETRYFKELQSLDVLSNGEYRLISAENQTLYTECIQDVSKVDTQVRLGLGKDSKEHLCKSAEANIAREQLFEKFWKAYPKKKGKGNCERWFASHKPNEELVDTMITAIEVQKHSKDWIKDNGQYIPLPYTWLNGKRWEDETTVSSGNSVKSRFKEVLL